MKNPPTGPAVDDEAVGIVPAPSDEPLLGCASLWPLRLLKHGSHKAERLRGYALAVLRQLDNGGVPDEKAGARREDLLWLMAYADHLSPPTSQRADPSLSYPPSSHQAVILSD